MLIRAKVLTRTLVLRPHTIVETREVTWRTIKNVYVSYEYYLVRAGSDAARISRHAAVLLGVLA